MQLSSGPQLGQPRRRLRLTRFVCAAAVVTLTAAGGLAPMLAPAAARAADAPTSAPHSAQADAAAVTIFSNALKVNVDRTFPQVVSYTDKASGGVMHGNEDPLTQVVVNGSTHTPVVTSELSEDRIDYVMKFPDYGGVEIDATVQVEGAAVDFAVTKIADTMSNPVNTLSIPEQNLVSVRSTDGGAAFAGARMDQSRDTFSTLDASTPADPAPTGWMYAIVNNAELAATITTNSEYDDPSGATAIENSRIMKQVVAKDGYNRLGLWSGDWLYHPRQAAFDKTEPLPHTKVVITGDRNDDSKVDWQDGAIASRDIMTSPQGWQSVAQQPVERIPFNFASTATHPFLQTLDETKRIWLNTDGLGQSVILKGYANEGHDSGHPDYAGVGTKQGGAADLNTLVNAAHKYNANIGVHLQGNEEYPNSPAFDPALAIDVKTRLGWDWLDQSYLIDKRYDGVSGRRLARLTELKRTVPNLDFLYIDSYPGDGYVGNEFAREVNGLGWRIATEASNALSLNTTWTHWANEAGSSAFNSQIARFMGNHQKDTWGNDPLLGKATLPLLEGWHNGTDYNGFIKTTFATNVPTKYLQGFPIMKWTPDTVTFTDGVSVSNATGTRQITKDGHLILNGGAYLLPWSQTKETKLYHWNSAGGTTTWTLPDSWGSPKSVKLYKLTDNGRTPVQDLPVTDRRITITAEANTPYVVYKSNPGAVPDPHFGHGTPLSNPSFEASDLSGWTIGGDSSKASQITNTRGQRVLQIAPGDGTTVSQKMTGLTGGRTYAVTADVQVPSSSRRTRISVKPAAGTAVTNYTDSSPFKNFDGASDYNGTTMQPMKVLFQEPAGQTTATLTLSADSGTVASLFANVRVVATSPTDQAGHDYYTGFEHETGQMWGPFVYAGSGGGPTNGRTHLAPKNAPYTQAGWNGQLIDDVIDGNYSLKSHGDGGLIYRTLPQTLRFKPNHTYKVTLAYEASNGGEYAFVTPGGQAKFAAAHTPTTFTTTFAANPDDSTWIGVQRVGSSGSQHDLSIDDLAVDDLGYTPEGGPAPAG
ncbi:endo-alpha-N-acetylgalactosaminidase [Kribbella aluminosa]|uniref:Endo-alpha-N-acetylgalactosaminidase n=1 Tax=Kribbella aluminosa TaxID=416017 RepID=A0ABS4UX60_9ACTN|nr:endo-alpha-N-acetylgalactosaminidase family protein [Kribbella aluminosa]MBP2356126.1 endo-alpha-N-acetylgalactosaminidase [Kribbella aluminosa]